MARITRESLLTAGWHMIWDEKNGTQWVHHNFDFRSPFNVAAQILKQRGVDHYGEMR